VMYHAVSTAFGTILEGRGLIAFAAYAAAALAGGAVLHYAIERPALRWRDRWLLSTHRIDPVPQGAGEIGG